MSAPMDASRWREVREALQRAIALSGDGRADFMRALIARDRELHDEVASLLAAGPDEGPAPARDEEAAGRRVGPYRILRAIGQGGMGMVFLAERADGGFEQRVALKLVHGALGSLDRERRFKAERQILARLEHPNIARLLDGGSTDDGLSWFSMEYVEGERIDDYCDSHHLSIEQRLRLFLDVCAAVSYAQRNLVIHRDLKPSNILVTPSGQAKLLDFGIARLLDDDTDVERTRTDARVMTPAYASPEQVTGEPITTATDVYALGVVLYELLTGSRPFDAAGPSAAALERAIVTAEPARPSAVRPTGGAALAGDLDNICLKALAKEPAKRYGTADDLGADLRRHLAHEPVLASPPRRLDLIRKFVRRNRAAVAATGLIVVALVAGLALAATGFVRARAERDRARLEARKSEQVANFLERLFEVADPEEARGKTLTADQILARGAAQVRRDLHEQPAVQARMMDVIGRVYRRLGMYSESRPLLEEALAIRRKALEPTHRDVAESLMRYGQLLADLNEDSASVALLGEAVRVAKASDDPSLAARALGHLAFAVDEAGGIAPADTLYRAAIEARRQNFGPESRELAESLNDYGTFLQKHDDNEGSRLRLQEALRINRAILGEDSPSVANNRFGLANVAINLGEYAAAVQELRLLTEIDRHQLGDRHPFVAFDMMLHARALGFQGRLVEAESLFARTLALQRSILPHDHSDISTTLYDYGIVLRDAGALARAEEMMSDVLERRRRHQGNDHVYTAISMGHLGWIYLEQGRLDEAEHATRECMRLMAAARDSSQSYARYRVVLGRILLARGDAAGARALFEQSVTELRRMLPPGHPNTGLAIVQLGEALSQGGEPLAGEKAIREGLVMLESKLGARHWSSSLARGALAAALAAQGRGDESTQLYGHAIGELEGQFGAGDHRVRALRRQRSAS